MSKDLGCPRALIGRTIVGVREITHDELEANDWHKEGFGAIIQLDNGTEISAMSDEEGNGFGVLTHNTHEAQAYVQPGKA